MHVADIVGWEGAVWSLCLQCEASFLCLLRWKPSNCIHHFQWHA